MKKLLIDTQITAGKKMAYFYIKIVVRNKNEISVQKLFFMSSIDFLFKNQRFYCQKVIFVSINKFLIQNQLFWCQKNFHVSITVLLNQNKQFLCQKVIFMSVISFLFKYQ